MLSFTLSYFPKEISEGSHLFECSLSFNLLISNFDPPTTQTFRCLIPQRRGSLKNLTKGSHWLECSHFLNLLISNFDPPMTQTFRCLIVLGVVWSGPGRISREKSRFVSSRKMIFFLFSKILPTTSQNRPVYWVVGWLGGWAYYLLALRTILGRFFSSF